MLRTGFLVGALIACILSFAGCGENRSASHAEQAQARLADGNLDDALIEMHNALRLDPGNADYSHRIAELLMIKGRAVEARFYYREAYRLEPQRFEAAIRLATLQFSVSPDESRALIEEVVANGPNSAWGAIGQSEQALYGLDPVGALEYAQRAVGLDATNPDAHWQLAIANAALIQELSAGGGPVPDEPFEAALAALDRFSELSPERAWRAVAENARLYTAWRGHADEARASLRAASDRLGELGLLEAEFGILDRAIDVGRSNSDVALEEWALERKIERIPDLYTAWDELALLYDNSGRTAGTVYNRLFAAFPDATEPRIRHARYMRRKFGRRRAIKVLERYIEKGFDEAPLLAEIARNQSLLGRRPASLRTIAKLEAKYPNSRESIVMAAWGWLQSGKPRVAIEVLDENAWTDDDIPAQRIRVDAYTRMGDTASTVEAVERLIELLPEPDLLTRRRYAQALFEDGRLHAARDAYRRLQRAAGLSPEESARYAVALFETNSHAIGRTMLERAVDQPHPAQLAVFSLYRIEGAQERNRERLRAGFAKLLEATPNHPRVLTQYVRFEIEANEPANALAPIARSVDTARRGGHPLARILSLQARVQDAMGEREAARATALEALDLAPAVPGALEFAQGLYKTKQDALAAIAQLTDGVDNEAQPPQRHALLGRLYYRAGNSVMARWSYEQALTGGLELPILKNDLAFLLAQQKRDLKRAKVLAMQANQELPNQSGVIDTLGFVLLQLGDYAGAAEQLRHGIEIAKVTSGPQAELQYHLGLALRGLERMNEAEGAFSTALALGEDFPDEEAARKELASIRGEI